MLTFQAPSTSESFQAPVKNKLNKSNSVQIFLHLGPLLQENPPLTPALGRDTHKGHETCHDKLEMHSFSVVSAVITACDAVSKPSGTTPLVAFTSSLICSTNASLFVIRSLNWLIS